MIEMLLDIFGLIGFGASWVGLALSVLVLIMLLIDGVCSLRRSYCGRVE